MKGLALLGLVVAVAMGAGEGAREPAARVDFGRDVRPILSRHCFPCHGPDEGARKAGLRLDRAEAATAELTTGNRAIVPGDVAESELVARVTHESARRRMPPQSLGKPLSEAQIDTLARWIEQGAEYRDHWSFVPPVRPRPPDFDPGELARAGVDPSWPRGDVDRFLLARMRAEGLRPSPPASRETLLRRVTLALTGLPPEPAEIDAFLADGGDDAFEKVVRRLLGSPRYAEHMARYWLDLARYGDTHGYHLDNERSLWRWREWVIDAFRRNLPFDRFTIEQLAGDLLPDATASQRIATGFLRCNPTTGEGGLIEEEYLVKYVVDRVNTASTVWLGLTVGCAQCHDHKFDPITQRDYYGMFAFFHSIAERGSDENALSPAPAMKAPSPEQAAALAELDARIAGERRRLDAPMPEVDAAQAAWESELAARLAGRWRPLDPTRAASSGGSTLAELEDRSLLASGTNPPVDVIEIDFESGLPPSVTALRVEALADPSLPMGGPGRAPNGNFVLTGLELEVVGGDGRARRVEIASALADHEQEGFNVTNAVDGDATTGWAILPALVSHQAVLALREPLSLAPGESLRLRLRHESVFPQHGIGRVRVSATADAALSPATASAWRMLGPFPSSDGDAAYRTPFGPEADLARGVDFAATFSDGRGGALAWIEKPEWTDGSAWTLSGESCAVYLARTIDAPAERSLTLSLGSDDALKAWVNGAVVLDRNVERSVAPDQDRVTVDLVAGANVLVLKVVNYRGGFAFHFRRLAEEPDGVPLALSSALLAVEGDRTGEQRAALREHFRRRRSPEWKAIEAGLRGLEQERAALDAQVPATMVAAELPAPRMTTLLVRGQYDRKGDPVEAAIPPALGRLPAGAPRDRLGFAQWLVARENPLTARVAVNRLFAQLFGEGIVRTAQDFGAQGEWPAHEELLDWLAVELMESGWDVQHVLELLVTSAAFRQSSAVAPELLAIDRENRLLARGPRFRLDAEEIRDLALAASGLLVERIGGRSVKPYQPGDLWKVVAYPTSNTARFEQDHGEALWRRSLYTFWKRTAPPANLTTFDAPSRESCTVQRPRTNTPLQALVLMNDVQFVEAARVLAQRVLRESAGRPADAIRLAWRRLLGRLPGERELEICLAAHARELARFRADPAAAAALLGHGEAPLDPSLDPAGLAAFTVVATTLLNLDETITRG